ncbi:hypothetical protein TPL01_25130 [Sulfuriferula plumbiphila]|uniref:Elongation factor-1 alpha n=1 Tax=Sulfuriferula plumbiphila TaxID=171865 RepID=A0A512LA63_9PROT|nr:hypothetical protein [Sulfuriferula plumbiphila]BBP03075.1 hypothetical protein SFPGR_04970 [Sulfuriferula plumbiphila]GEP31375.1 hypothetical protein TPL01_25130 [Sulfuriferula plumbiphila]
MNHDLKQYPQPITGMTLRRLPVAMRALFSCFLITIGMGFLAAIYYLFLQDVDPHQRMGMSLVPSVAAKYYGERSGTRLESALRGSMSSRISAADKAKVVGWLRDGATQDGFAGVQPIFENTCAVCHSAKPGLPIPPLTTFEQVKALAQVDMGTSLLVLARVSHVHLFGISIIFLLTGTIFAMSEISWKWRLPILVIPYLAIWADIGSWWMTKYEPVFAYVVVGGGALLGSALGVQIFFSLWEMWFADRPSKHTRQRML